MVDVHLRYKQPLDILHFGRELLPDRVQVLTVVSVGIEVIDEDVLFAISDQFLPGVANDFV